VSFLNRLFELSNELTEPFINEDPAEAAKRDSLRYHDIDWTARNIPIQRQDLVWLPDDYRNGEEDYPLIQVHISKALGRIVGFWDECGVFNIVLLDPLHNLQPSTYVDYKVRPCSPLACQFTSLLSDIEAVKRIECANRACPTYTALSEVPDQHHYCDVIIFRADTGTVDLAKSIIAQGQAKSFQEILETGILHHAG